MSCKEQEIEIISEIESHVDGILNQLANRSYDDAVDLAKRYNEEDFYGEKLIEVRRNFYERGGRPEVSVNKNLLDKVIGNKIIEDNQIEIENEAKENLRKREEELREGNNLIDDDFFDDFSDPDASVDKDGNYNAFDYDSVLSNKLLLKEKLEKQRDLLKNKANDKEGLAQIEYLNELIKKLYIDTTNLQKLEYSLDAYIDNIEKDLENVKQLLKNPTLENIQAVNDYLEVLNLFTNDGPNGFLNQPLTEIKDKDSEIWQKLENVQGKIKNLEAETNTRIKQAVKETIKFHLEQKEENKNWDEEQLKAEVERLYENQLSKTIGKMGWTKSQFTMLEDHEEKNVLVSVMYKIYTDAIAMNNNKDERKILSNMKDEVLNELKRLGKTVGKGLRKKGDQSIFLRKSDTAYQLIGKFSEQWVNFKRAAKNKQSEISRILYKENKTDQEYRDIKKHFDNLNENVDFIDVNMIPEIVESEDFQEYSEFFNIEDSLDEDGNIVTAKNKREAYKKELIDKIGEREYNKILQEQKQHLYSYQIFKELRESRLRDKYNLEPSQSLEGNVSQRDLDAHTNTLNAKSPFVFAKHYKEKGNNLLSKKYHVNGQEFNDQQMPADMEYISYIPKKQEYFDSNFAEIEGNPILNKAWGHMANLVEYNNNNGFNRDPDNLTEYSLASQEKRVSGLPARIMGLLSRDTLDRIHKALTTTRYKETDGDYNVAGQIRNVDQDIQDLYEAKIKRVIKPTAAQKVQFSREAKEEVMARQDTDLIDNILASTEITETFKAKREVESKLKFLKRHLDENTDRKRFKELTDFFLNKTLYQINNRANFNRAGKDFNLSDTKLTAWTKFYTAKEKELRKASKESKKALQKFLKTATNPELIADAQKEIVSIDKFLESGGQVLTPGSIIEASVIKVARVAAFSLNFSAQITNQVIASINAKEVDGKLGYWQAGVYHDAVSFTRKWKSLTGDKEYKKERKTGELLLQRLQLFQNSANEMFKLEKSKSATVLGSVLENPMNFVSEVEKTIQRPQIFALMSELEIEGVDENGKPTKVLMFDPKTRTFPAFSFDSDGNLELTPNFNTPQNRATFIDNTSQEYANLFGDGGRVPKAIAHINGDYRESSTYLFEKQTLTAMALMFKRWSVETLRKKFGVFKRLGENEHAGLAMSSIAMTGGAFMFATGAMFGPIALGTGLALYTLHHGKKKVEQSLKNDTFNIKNAATALLNVRLTPMRSAFKSNLYLSLAVAAQSLGMIIDPFTKKQLINSDRIKEIIKLKDKKSDGTEFTSEEIRQIQDDIFFLTTSIATTLKFLALKALVMLALYPDEDEEEAHKERVKQGEKFWERLYADPTTAMYYTLENMLSGFIEDGNMLFNSDGLVRDGDVFGLSKFGNLRNNIEDYLQGDGDFKGGLHEGENKFLVNLMRYNTPAVLKDGLSLGFGSKSKKDFDTNNYIDQYKVPVLKKVNKKRLEARRLDKKKLLAEGHDESVVNSILADKYPVIKEEHLNSKGKLHVGYKHMWESYY